jgi:hypothetical protein
LAQRVALLVFVGGLVGGGLFTAALAWIASGLARPAPDEAAAVVLVGIAVGAVARDFRVIVFRLPQNARQVPREVFLNGPFWSSLQFGFELGTGFRTLLPATAPYVLLAATVLVAPGLWVTLVLGASFGIGRAIMTASRYFSSDRGDWDARLQHRTRSLVRGSASLTLFATLWLVFFE